MSGINGNMSAWRRGGLGEGGGLEEGWGLLRMNLGSAIDSGPGLEKLTCKTKVGFEEYTDHCSVQTFHLHQPSKNSVTLPRNYPQACSQPWGGSVLYGG